MQPNYPIGIDDFRKLRQLQLAYVDKTHLIAELLDKPGTEVFLLPRPRRFGKTLNLSMLRYFFSRSTEDHAPLFAGSDRLRRGTKFRGHLRLHLDEHNRFAVARDNVDFAMPGAVATG